MDFNIINKFIKNIDDSMEFIVDAEIAEYLAFMNIFFNYYLLNNYIKG